MIDGGESTPDDMISVLTRAYLAGTLQYGELRRLCQQLLVAGHETTASLISFMLYRLIEQPRLLDELRGDPSITDAAIEEFLRHESPVQGLFRTNAAPCTIGDVELGERTKAQLLFAAANRDPAVWPEPDEIRFDRGSNHQHLAFGWGIHHCLGAALARQEARVALRLMVERFDRVELVGPVAVNQPFILRGLTTMPIRWTVR